MKIWFKKKVYGYGWYPAAWQGWLLILIFVFFNIWNFLRLDSISHSNSDTLRPFIIQGFLSLIFLLIIVVKKGEKPSWSWGKNLENK